MKGGEQSIKVTSRGLIAMILRDTHSWGKEQFTRRVGLFFFLRLRFDQNHVEIFITRCVLRSDSRPGVDLARLEPGVLKLQIGHGRVGGSSNKRGQGS